MTEPVPVRRITPAFLTICLLVIVLALVWTISRRRTHDDAPSGTPLQSADLVLEDRDDGSVAVFRAPDHALVDVVPPATNGFLRVVLAGLVRERRREGLGSPGIAFHLARWPGGRITVDDLATHQVIDLDAFGPSNAGAFAHLLDQSAATPQPCAGTATPGCTGAGRGTGGGE